MKRTQYEPSETLKACKLWHGSGLEVSYRFHMLTREMLVEKRDSLLRCDDRTRGENEVLRALTAELAA